ncbi:hypothetical protein GGR50DRAFT_438575 [Xylaria sp. CBS 124048]|nr:hypothetical protein GGR50DRAFT_438575 [Xylaria sp. CBS 124048]
MEIYGNRFPTGTISPSEQPHEVQRPESRSLPTHLQQRASTSSPSSPPRQYTTVGSVYNPQLQPLQPPIRRGRTVKTLFPYKSESPPVGPSQLQLQYTQLQQNSDRAVSPARFNPGSLPSNQPITREERQVLQKFGVAVPDVQQQTSNMAVSLQSPIHPNANASQMNGLSTIHNNGHVVESIALGQPTPFVNAIAESDNGSDGTNTKPISAMNFNSLTNLASYPNPMQRAAQKVLASHRPQPNPNAGLQVSGSQSTHYSADGEPWVSPAEASAHMTLSQKIRGAPAPLTAGPPGVRQFRPSAFDQETLQRVREFDDENPMMNPYHPRLRSSQHTGGASMEAESMSSAPRNVNDYDDFEAGDDGRHKNNDNSRVIDTITADEACAFYPGGLPSNFNSRTQHIPRDWALKRLSMLECGPDLYSIQRQDGFWAQRSSRINNLFYGGYNEFNKKLIDPVVSEHCHDRSTQIVGHYSEQPNSQLKLANRRVHSSNPSFIQVSEQ